MKHERRKMRRMTTVSLEADAQYKRAFAQVAIDEGKDEGELVRRAIDDKFGEAITRWLSFFAQAEPQKAQMNLVGSETGDA